VAETNVQYANFYISQSTKLCNLLTDTWKIMLLGNGYTPNTGPTDLGGHQFVSDLGANEITGTGYTAGGITLAGLALIWNPVANQWLWTTTTTPSWTGAAFSAYYGVVYDDTPSTAATRPLATLVNFGGVKSPSAGTFTLNWPLTGIAYQNILAAA
jgi:hypothetical protein